MFQSLKLKFKIQIKLSLLQKSTVLKNPQNPLMSWKIQIVWIGFQTQLYDKNEWFWLQVVLF